MRKNEMVAMILAGGQGSRLGVLTKNIAKPAVPYGGKYRIIDFPLSNCSNSRVYTVGVLTQYKPLELNAHIGIGAPWDLDRRDGGVSILPPYQEEKGGNWYKGTANAIYQNIEFIDRYNPEYVLILSGDHIYKMNYEELLNYHKEKEADVTISVIDVTLEEAKRFGIMNTNDDLSIYEFEEKPQHPKSTKASMGIYIFNWKALKKYLKEDEANPNSSNDFGKDIIPAMLRDGLKLYAYPFKGYWKDVGTIDSLWEANMDLLKDDSGLDLYSNDLRIYSASDVSPAQYLGPNADIKNSLVTDGCAVYGKVENSVIFQNVYIGKNTVIKDSVIMPNAKIGDNVTIKKSIVGDSSIIRKDSIIGNGEKIVVIPAKKDIKADSIITEV